MCKCTPEIRTPFCGKENCTWPPQVNPGTELPVKQNDFDNYGLLMGGGSLSFWGGSPIDVSGDVQLKGWYCPNCTKTHSPYVNTCPDSK